MALTGNNMNLICKWFGHRPAFGWGNKEGEGYFRITRCIEDAIGRVHASLHCNCERCGAWYQVGKTHLPVAEPFANREGWENIEKA